MVQYAQVKRRPGKPAEVTLLQTPPEGWDDTEEAELEWLARGAAELARRSLTSIDRAKAEACRKKMLDEMRKASK